MSEFVKEYEQLNETLVKYDINIVEETAKQMFENHMESYWNRIKDGSLIDDDSYEMILNEIKEENLNIAHEISNIFDEDTPMMERVLIATHIQTYFENKEEN